MPKQANSSKKSSKFLMIITSKKEAMANDQNISAQQNFNVFEGWVATRRTNIWKCLQHGVDNWKCSNGTSKRTWVFSSPLPYLIKLCNKFKFHKRKITFMSKNIILPSIIYGISFFEQYPYTAYGSGSKTGFMERKAKVIW